MSHICQIKRTYYSIEAMDLAMAECGMERRNKEKYNWYGRWVGDTPFPDHIASASPEIQKKWIEKLGSCDFCYGIPGDDNYSYEVGVRKRDDGKGYEVLFDWYGGKGSNLLKRIGERGRKFNVAYSKHLLALALKQIGGRRIQEKTAERKIEGYMEV